MRRFALYAEEDRLADPPFPRNGIKSMRQESCMKLFHILDQLELDWDEVKRLVSGRSGDGIAEALALVDERLRTGRLAYRRLTAPNAVAVHMQHAPEGEPGEPGSEGQQAGSRSRKRDRGPGARLLGPDSWSHSVHSVHTHAKGGICAGDTVCSTGHPSPARGQPGCGAFAQHHISV